MTIFRGRPALGALLLAAATVLAWLAWLGFDTQKELDPATGSETGPYSVQQVAGCVLTLAGLLVGAILAGVPRWTAAAVMTVAFTVAWTAGAAANDDSGLFAVGAVLVAAATAAGTAAVAALTGALRRNR